MNKTKAKPEVKVTLSIAPGPVNPAAKASWKKWWTARVAEAKQSEAKNE